MIRLKSDKIIADGKMVSGYVYVDGGKISSVSEKYLPADEEYDFTGKYLSPGFIDMHTHGGGGHAFIDSSAEEVGKGCDFHLLHGTTSILPTISAAKFKTMKKAVENIAAAKDEGLTSANVIGAHLEGPYLSEKQSGAQCPDFITLPVEEDYRALVSEYGEYIARWTYAPEKDEGGKFCDFIVKNGIIASAGHTDATYEDMKIAIEKGCNLITHLYSCTSTVTRNRGFRSLGVIESAFYRDELKAEIIADGKHLPPELIKMIIKIKGEDNVALITDSLEIAGTDIKEGVMSGTPFIVEDGVCKLRDRSAFAGSVATGDGLIRVMTKECGYDIFTAVKTFTEVPAGILKLNKGKIARGYDADVIVFDDEINVSSVFVGGKKVK